MAPALRGQAAGADARPRRSGLNRATGLALRERLLRPDLGELWTFLAVALPTIGALAAPMSTVDLAYQLRAGAAILAGNGIPSADSWTFTVAGAPWHDLQWGAQALLAAVFEAAGWSGLAILRAALVGLAFGLLLATVRRRAPGLPARTAALLVIGAFVVAAPALALRPQLVAIVLFAATLLLLGDRGEHPVHLWIIPVLAAIWANVHGTFPLALVLVGLAWLEDLVERPPRWHLALATGLAAAAATAINPVGLRVWTDALGLATNPVVAGRVSEWRPPSPFELPGLLLYASVVAVILVVQARYARREIGTWRPSWPVALLLARPPWPTALAVLAFGGLAIVTARGVAWWPFVAAATVAGVLAGEPFAKPTAAAPAVAARRSVANAAIAAVIILAGLALLPIWRPVGPAGVPTGLLADAPQGIAAELRRTAAEGERVWNPQIWGSWLELSAPKVLVATDSRIELFPASVWDEADQVSSASGKWRAILDAERVRTVITSAVRDTALESAIGVDAQWQRIYHDADGSIWRRAAPP